VNDTIKFTGTQPPTNHLLTHGEDAGCATIVVFPRVQLGELIAAGEAELKTGPFGTQLKASEYKEEGTPVINVRNIGMGRIKADKLEFLSDATRDRLSSHLLRSGDIVFGRKGAVERHVYIQKEQDGWFQGSDCLRLRFTSARVISLFASYFFMTEEHQQWIMNQCSHGATMSSLNQGILERIELPMPSLSVQRRIAGILSAYDDLIENCQRRIKILESMARSLYREWFVNFRFPGHENIPLVPSPVGDIPQGWEVKPVKDILSRSRAGKVYREADVNQNGAIPVFDQSTNEVLGFHDNEPDQFASPASPVAIFGDHTCKMQLLIEPFSVGPNVVTFAASQKLQTSYVFFVVNSLVQTQEYKRHWAYLNAKDVVVADKTTAQSFALLIQPMLVQEEIFRKAIRNLRQTRNILLPRLLSRLVNLEMN
jgi:type I restriction enzyme, S subunit